jgi:hypothetical protein
LEKRSELLQTKIDYALDYIQQGELIHVQKMEYFAELDSTFASLDYVFAWGEAWEIGLAFSAIGPHDVVFLVLRVFPIHLPGLKNYQLLEYLKSPRCAWHEQRAGFFLPV